MKKLITVIMFAALLIFAACGGNDAGEEVRAEGHPVNFAVLRGPSAFGALRLMDAAAAGQTRNAYNIELVGSPDEIVPMLVRGELDIAAVPTNMASVLYNNPNVQVTQLVSSTMGVLHIVDTTGEINSVADLAGRTVHLSGLGATPEFALNYVLRMNGLEPGVDVVMEFHAEMSQIAALMAEGTVQVALLPEPFATTVVMQNPDARHALDLSEEWRRVQPDYGMVMTAIIVRNEFLAQNPEAIAIFMQEYAESVHFVNNYVEEAAEMAVAMGLIPNINIAMQAIPRTNQVFITGADMMRYVQGFLNVLYNESPASIGGALPGADFYFTD